MMMNSLLRASLYSIAALLILASTPLSSGADLRISKIAPEGQGTVKLTVTGSSPNPVTLQSSPDLKSWADVKTLALNGTPLEVSDTKSASGSRVYRLRDSGAIPPPSTLPELGDLQNRVFPAPEGGATIQYAANGMLGFIVWRDQSLIFRERSPSGAWTEAVLANDGNVFKPYLVFDFTAPREDYRFQPAAVLLYDSASKPHVFRASGRELVHYARNSSGQWSVAERFSNSQANGNIVVLDAAVGPNNVFHFAALSAGSPRNLTYGSNKNGQWNWTTISTVGEPPLTYWAPPFAARWLSLAVDQQNNAHIAFRSGLDLTYDGAGHPRAYSELKYASNKSGQWTTSTVIKPRDLSGEAANGASIAIAPDNTPRIVSWYDERADTGSAQESRLYWHQPDGGNWSSSVIATSPDGYIAGDGPKGTGFSPSLRFDSRGRAHIVYLDHAGEHFGGIGQQEYAGNVRHAWWNGNSWSFETVYRQTAPLQQQAVYPAFAVSGNEMAVTVLQRETQWNLSSFPPLSNSKYYFRFLVKPLP